MRTVSVKLTFETRKMLRLIAAYTDENHQEIMERLTKIEWEKVQEKEHEQDKQGGKNRVAS